MTSTNPLPRRAILKGAGLGLGAGMLACITAAAEPAAAIWSREYWTKKGEVPLYIVRKRLGEPKPREPLRPVLAISIGAIDRKNKCRSLLVGRPCCR